MDKLDSFLLKSISYNMVLQFGFRIISFVLNALLIRYVNTELIGACNFRLTLLYTTIMFLSREPFRRALPSIKQLIKRKKETNESTLFQFINSSWLVVASGLVLSTLFGLIWMFMFERPDETLVYNYDLSVITCCLACLIELMAEPFFALTQLFFMTKLKVVVEAICLFSFNCLFVAMAILFPSLGSMSYSLARLLFSLGFIALNAYFSIRNLNRHNENRQLVRELTSTHDSSTSDKLDMRLDDFLPLRRTRSFDMAFLSLVRAYFMQSIFKQILTEGERYLITVFSLLSISESGIYDLINNLGSLIARFVFLPIEEQSYFYFINAFKRGVTYAQQQDQQHQTDKNNNKNKVENNDVIPTSSYSPKRSFENLLKCVCIIAILVVVFGQSYSQLALQLFGGERLGQNSVYVNMLRCHCIYILLLAINGVTESFYNATMSESQLEVHNYRLIRFSIIYLINIYMFAKLFSLYGFLLANCLNMLIRIYYSNQHIKSTFKGYIYMNDSFMSDKQEDYNLNHIFLPDWSVCIMLAISLALTKISEHIYLLNTTANTNVILSIYAFGHVALGAILFLSTLIVIFYKEKHLTAFFTNFLKNRKSKA